VARRTFNVTFPAKTVAVKAEDESQALWKVARALGKLSDGHDPGDDEFVELGFDAASVKVEKA
jgi:hypothetical protein